MTCATPGCPGSTPAANWRYCYACALRRLFLAASRNDGEERRPDPEPPPGGEDPAAP